MATNTISNDEIKTQSRTIYYTLAYFAGFVLLGMATSAIGPALPSLAEQTHSPLGEIGFLFTASSLGYMLGSLSGGWAYDRVRGNILLAVSALVTAAGLGLVPLIGQLAALTAVMFMLGVGEGTLDVGGNLLLVWVHRDRAAPFLNGLHFSFGLGAMLMPIIVAQALVRLGGIQTAFWLMSLLALPLAVYVLRLPSPAAPGHSREEVTRPVNWLMVGLISLLFFLYVGAETGFGGWIFTYAQKLNLGSLRSAGFLTSAFWGALMAGRLVIIPIAHRFRPERIILFDFAGCLISLGLIVALPESAVAVWIGALGFGFFNGPIFPTMLAYAERRMTMSGQASRWFFVGTGAGGMFLPWLMGKLFTNAGPVSLMWAVLIDVVAAVGAFGLVRMIKTKA